MIILFYAIFEDAIRVVIKIIAEDCFFVVNVSELLFGSRCAKQNSGGFDGLKMSFITSVLATVLYLLNNFACTGTKSSFSQLVE